MRRIHLSNSSLVALIDDEWAHLRDVPWYLNNGYAARMAPKFKGRRRILYLHRVVAGVQDEETGIKISRRRVRIRGHNRLDNRLSNLN